MVFGAIAALGSAGVRSTLPNLLGTSFGRASLGPALRGGATTFASSLPFGAGYSFGTYIGFPKNYQDNNFNSKTQRLTLSMPYGSYYPRRRRYSSRYSNRRYSRYGSRYGSRYRSRRSSYGRRSYYGRRYY